MIRHESHVTEKVVKLQGLFTKQKVEDQYIDGSDKIIEPGKQERLSRQAGYRNDL